MGLVSLIFFIFFLKPGDPARMMGGQHASPDVIEAIRKDLGLELYNSLVNDDLPVVMGSVLFIAAIFVIMNILVDILYGILDPRIGLK
jgi:ABC-type dipeptide/oligopeptide/nickel transport system permease component